MTESSNLCLSCGLCCDGTLIGFVQLDTDEIADVKKIKNIEEVDGKGFFFQPCEDYCDGCTIYDHRPKQCGIFKCGLLKSVEQKELAFDSAIDIIKIVKQKKFSIQQKFETLDIELQSNSLYYKMLELKKLLRTIKADSDIPQNQQELLLEIEQLDVLVSSKFDLN